MHFQRTMKKVETETQIEIIIDMKTPSFHDDDISIAKKLVHILDNIFDVFRLILYNCNLLKIYGALFCA